MFKKRLLAYFIDIIILSLILTFVGLFIPSNSNLVNLNNELMSVNNNFMNQEIDAITFINQYSNIGYSIARELFLSNLISVAVGIIYFIVYPLYNGGQSIGKKIIGLKIVSVDDSDVSSNSLLIRYLLMESIGATIISMCLIFVIKDFYYILCDSILSFLQFLVVIISVFMVIYRRDKRSLPDLIAGTKVIEVKKWEN